MEGIWKLLNDVSGFLEVLEKEIKSTGFYRVKAKNIIAAAKSIRIKFNGKLPQTMEEMTMLPGIARKSANIILGNVYGVVEGIAVDTHVRRVSRRLHLVNPDLADPEKIETELMAVIPKKNWFCLTYLLIEHGRACCRALRPDCASCVIRAYCPSKRA